MIFVRIIIERISIVTTVIKFMLIVQKMPSWMERCGSNVKSVQKNGITIGVKLTSSQHRTMIWRKLLKGLYSGKKGKRTLKTCPIGVWNAARQKKYWGLETNWNKKVRKSKKNLNKMGVTCQVWRLSRRQLYEVRPNWIINCKCWNVCIISKN